MNDSDKKVCLINDERLNGYTKRTRSGTTQVFYYGSDERDFARYTAERSSENPSPEMHDKKDTIRLQPPERHYYSKLIDGEWWWMNGCAECNGQKRTMMSYVECKKHDVCRTCKTSRDDVTGCWGGMNGWQCNSCKDSEWKEARQEALFAVNEKEYDEWDYSGTDKVICPHCASSYEPDCDTPEGDEICEVCHGEYTVDPEYTVTFSTTCKGERITE